MFAGTSQGDEQALKFVDEEKLNLKYFQINAKIVRSQEEDMKTKYSNKNTQQNSEAEREGPADDWSRKN